MEAGRVMHKGGEVSQDVCANVGVGNDISNGPIISYVEPLKGGRDALCRQEIGGESNNVDHVDNDIGPVLLHVTKGIIVDGRSSLGELSVPERDDASVEEMSELGSNASQVPNETAVHY
ncbi:excinuclease ABC subunit UvrA [Sesbania bispinosa]|nr:excinuclease ABC subunit UvrA [Sesbania bispinosa]